ncbi:MAG: MBG domain-containing protein [Actinobacteria bacterium]|nr:MBG domain-containing protein [Actinomycetota bacterium]
MWWNGSSWIECSNYTIDAAGNVTVTITGSTTPSLSDLTGTVFTLVAAPVEIVTVRTNPITPGGLTSDNYDTTFEDGTQTITKARLIVTAGDASRMYGLANPAFTGTITGIKNLDNITVVYDCSAIPSSLPGSYTIVPTVVDPDKKLGNYDVTINNGTLTVVESPGSITIIKTDAVTGLPIDGATFNIYDDGGVLKETVITANGGVATASGFKWNVKYSIIEAAPAPAGYLLNTETFYAIFNADSLSATLYVKETPAGGAAAPTITVEGLTDKGGIIQALGFTGLDPIIPISGGAAIIAGLAMSMSTLRRRRYKNRNDGLEFIENEIG